MRERERERWKERKRGSNKCKIQDVERNRVGFERMWRKGTFLHCWWECKLIQLVWETSMDIPKKTKIDLPYDAQSYSWAYIQRKLI